jgi:hypothetical protein
MGSSQTGGLNEAGFVVDRYNQSDLKHRPNPFGHPANSSTSMKIIDRIPPNDRGQCLPHLRGCQDRLNVPIFSLLTRRQHLSAQAHCWSLRNNHLQWNVITFSGSKRVLIGADKAALTVSTRIPLTPETKASKEAFSKYWTIAAAEVGRTRSHSMLA